MLLVLASSIFVLVKDIEAVNSFSKNATDEDFADCDYIEYVLLNIAQFKDFPLTSSTILQKQHCTKPTCRCLLGCRQPTPYHFPSYHPHSLRDWLALRFLRALLPCPWARLRAWPARHLPMSHRSNYPLASRRRFYPRCRLLPVRHWVLEHVPRAHLPRGC